MIKPRKILLITNIVISCLLATLPLFTLIGIIHPQVNPIIKYPLSPNPYLFLIFSLGLLLTYTYLYHLNDGEPAFNIIYPKWAIFIWRLLIAIAPVYIFVAIFMLYSVTPITLIFLVLTCLMPLIDKLIEYSYNKAINLVREITIFLLEISEEKNFEQALVKNKDALNNFATRCQKELLPRPIVESFSFPQDMPDNKERLYYLRSCFTQAIQKAEGFQTAMYYVILLTSILNTTLQEYIKEKTHE